MQFAMAVCTIGGGETIEGIGSGATKTVGETACAFGSVLALIHAELVHVYI